MASMSPASRRRRQRRTGDLIDYRLSLSLGMDIGRRLRELADRHRVSVTVVARYAIEDGLTSAAQRLARETGGGTPE